MIAIRKFFGILTANEREQMEKECKLFLDILNKEVDVDNEIDRRYTDNINGRCPLCNHKKVISKYAMTAGEVSGNIFDVYGSTDTTKVNQCAKCGNQWKVQKRYYPDTEDRLKSLTYKIERKAENLFVYESSLYKYMIDNVHAETFYKLYCDEVIFGEDDVKLRKIRKVLKSIYEVDKS